MTSSRLDRLSSTDMMNFWAEAPGMPMHIALAGVLDLPAGTTLHEVVDELATRVCRVPELRQRVRWTRFGEGPPLLVDDQNFRVLDQIRVLEPAPLDPEARFAERAAALAIQPLDHDAPLWRATLLPDDHDDRVGLVFVLHHALADGIRGVVMAASLFDPTPGRVQPIAVAPIQPEPPVARLVIDNIRARLAAARYAVGLVRSRPNRGGGWREIRADLRGMATRAPQTSLNGPLGPNRRLTVVHYPLGNLRATAHERGVTINDLLLTAVSGGMREILLAHGDSVDDLELRVGVPVGAPEGSRNAGGAMPLGATVPVGDPDAETRLAQISVDMAAKKAVLDRQHSGVMRSPLMPSGLLHLMINVGKRRGSRMLNLYVTNVPGPADPLWLGNAQLTRPVPIAPLVAGQRISIAALSYNGELAVGIHTDADLAHTEHLVRGINSTFLQLDMMARPEPDPGGEDRGSVRRRSAAST